MTEWYDIVDKQLDDLRDTQKNYALDRAALLDDYKHIILLVSRLEELEERTTALIVKEGEP